MVEDNGVFLHHCLVLWIAQGLEKHQTLGWYDQTPVASMAGADAGAFEFRAALGEQASNWRSVRLMIPFDSFLIFRILFDVRPTE